MDLSYELPGGEDFQDVTALFAYAGQAMEPGECIFMEDFTLLDAMSAFEIGEPRLDSGVILEEERRPEFNPLQLMLPEEICWMMDRALSCEMEWHAGNNLSQTVFTVLHVHHLQEINPDLIPCGFFQFTDARLPVELVTVVYRAFVFGLLKCCDLAWRELFKGGVQDGEDWQGEKCDISLLEGITVRQIIAKLDEAITWLRLSPKSPGEWKDALVARLLLRKTMVEIMDANPFQNPSHYRALIAAGREHLHAVCSSPPPHPHTSSTAPLAFDPYIARRLNSFVPLRVVELRPLDKTWTALYEIFDGWEEVCVMASMRNVTTWTIFGDLRLWKAEPAQRIPYIRSLNQSTFFDGVLVLNDHAPLWLVERFFGETIGLSYRILIHTVEESWDDDEDPPSFRDIERKLIKLITNHVRSLWYNPPRKRRHLMKSVYDWHELYDSLLNITCEVPSVNTAERKLVAHCTTAVQLWRLSAVREVVLSGFQLELYYADEKAFAYYYAGVVIEAHLKLLEGVILAMDQNSAAYSEMVFQRSFLNALRLMSLALFAVSTRFIKFSEPRNMQNLARRYKWAWRPDYHQLETPVVAPFELEEFLPLCRTVLQDTTLSPSGSMADAREILLYLAEGSDVGWAGCWTTERIQFIRQLAGTCRELETILPDNLTMLAEFDVTSLVWDPARSPWFPSGSQTTAGVSGT